MAVPNQTQHGPKVKQHLRGSLFPFLDLKFTSVKVSNNALNFLLAQYRAIFKRAYVKGIASAVLLTAGLSAGQAQATIVVDGATQSGNAYVIPATGTNITIEAGSSDSIHFGNSKSSTYTNYTQTGGTLTGNHTESADRFSIAGTTTLSGVTAIVSGGDFIEGTNAAQNPWTGTLNLVDGTEVSVDGGAVNYNKINLEDGVNVTIGGTQYFDSTANNYYSSVGSVNVYGDNGSLNINTGATLTLTDNSAISILNGTTEHNALNLNGGTIIFDGSEFVNNFSGASSNKAAVIAGLSSGDLNFAAGSVQVNEGKYGEIRGANVNLTGATITQSLGRVLVN